MRWHWSPFDALKPSELYALLRLRQAVFVVEQDCAYLDADDKDADAHHLLGFDHRGFDHSRGDTLVAYLRAFPPGVIYAEAAIGRVVTHASVRGTGLGRPLMREGMRRVIETWGPVPIKVSAQAQLETFYVSLGFEVCGASYLEDGAPHLPMRCA